MIKKDLLLVALHGDTNRYRDVPAPTAEDPQATKKEEQICSIFAVFREGENRLELMIRSWEDFETLGITAESKGVEVSLLAID